MSAVLYGKGPPSNAYDCRRRSPVRRSVRGTREGAAEAEACGWPADHGRADHGRAGAGAQPTGGRPDEAVSEDVKALLQGRLEAVLAEQDERGRKRAADTAAAKAALAAESADRAAKTAREAGG